jgi:hypothetical protein
LAEIFPLTTPEEVSKHMSRIKPLSAPGLEGIREKHLKDQEFFPVLAKFFTLLMMTGVYPESWRQNRVIFIPKRGKDTTLAGSWRPITIVSMLARIYSGLFDGRLRGVTRLIFHQGGFTNLNGCHAILVILNDVIKRAKSGGRGVVVAVGIAKAFDTVPQASILAALRDQGLHPFAADLIGGIYARSTAVLRDGATLAIRRGVRQGDSLSLLLFNLALNSVLRSLERMESGIPLGALYGQSCSVRGRHCPHIQMPCRGRNSAK